MLVAITGSSGLIGSALATALVEEGHQVRKLVRHEPRQPDEVRWDPESVDPRTVDGADAVVHLAGVGIADKRWSAEQKAAILDSRVHGTSSIAGAIAAADTTPAVLLSGSATGWYGDTGDREVTENDPSGRGFLAEVVRKWESATPAAESVGTRVCHLRTGIVLSSAGGTLGRIKPLFQAGIGGRLGSGRQWFSWIALVDHLAAIRFLLTADAVSGPVNLVAPQPVTNADFTRALGRALHRPAVLPVPAAALRLVLGRELADEAVLASQRVLPAVLTEAGFRFAHPDIDAGLAAALT